MSWLNEVKRKILNSESLKNLLDNWHSKRQKIVFTNGCFDIIHRGHIEYLAKAADLGDKLIIGLNADESVQKLEKGCGRPIQDENSRALILASLSFVDAVCVFDEETPYELINIVQPDVLVKGGDWKPESIIGHDIVEAKGGEIVVIEFLEGYSTSSIEQKIIDAKS